MKKLMAFDQTKMHELAESILQAEWPNEENDSDILDFIFNYLYFLKTFFQLGK